VLAVIVITPGPFLAIIVAAAIAATLAALAAGCRIVVPVVVLAFDSKLTAIAFGVFVPFFFVVSGMKLDLPALLASAGAGAGAKMGVFSRWHSSPR
jgi:CPA2 family monovalent cation:H+ antiporter-2